MALICEKCDSDNSPDYGVKFDFNRGQYLCPTHHSFVVVGGISIKRKLINQQMSKGLENHLLDKMLSPEDGTTMLSKSTGREWHF